MTLKQKKAIENVVENGGNVSKAMRDAGYSPETAKTPQKLTESEAWQEMLGDRLPDHKLLDKLDEGLDANKVVSAVIVGAKANEQTNDFIDVPDYPTRHKYLETALKLKRRLGPEIIGGGTTNNILVIPSELISKYGIAHNTEGSSER